MARSAGDCPSAAPIEGAQNAPDPLQYPGVTAANAVTGSSLPVALLRNAIEDATNAQLCKVLMTDAKMVIPPDFDFTRCPAALAAKVNNRQGKVRWAANAKPSECGTQCVGRPTNDRDTNLDRPDKNTATVTGSIELEVEVEVPGPNRDVSFAWKAFARCEMTRGGPPHLGDIKFDVVVDPPVVGEPSFWEGVLDFFLGPIDWSNRINAGIKSQLSTPSGQSANTGVKCMSIGARLGGAPKTDAFAFETQPPRIIQKGRIATLKLISVTRKSTFGYTPPADPGSFLLYINGVGVGIPDVPALPLTGGTAALNMCKTINMDGSDRVQVIFTNALGGTTWSQFGRADNFGVGKAHTMTTGRSVVVPGHPSPGNMHPKPETLRLNEFELTYTIEHSNPLGQVGPLNAQAQVLSNGPTDPAPTPTPMPAAGSIRAQQHWNGAAKLSEAVPVPCRQL